MTLLGEIERKTQQTEDRGVLRFITAGSVDDGKSTLIARLLHDTSAVLEDQLAAVARASSKRGQEDIDLSLLTDGLEAEREQGITIDVAYRYFATPRRKFIIADTPGHVQYTRNMVTGASTADLALILVDARHGVVEQSRRHSVIASLLSVRHLVLCVNKMDLYGEEATEAIPPMSVTIRLEDNLDVSRGDLICRPNNAPTATQEIDAMICWFSERGLQVGGKYAIKHTTRSARALVRDLHYR